MVTHVFSVRMLPRIEGYNVMGCPQRILHNSHREERGTGRSHRKRQLGAGF